MENYERTLAEKCEEFFGRDGDCRLLQSWVDAVHGPDIVEEIRDTKDKIVVEDFSYDGTAPDAFFYVGTEGAVMLKS